MVKRTKNGYEGSDNPVVITLTKLPTRRTEVAEGFTDILAEKIFEIVKYFVVDETPRNVLYDLGFLNPLFVELKKHKEDLGGSPNFDSGAINPDDIDSHKSFFGIPLSAVKDWLRMTLVKRWKPLLFWEGTAKFFGITEYNTMSQYEEAYIRIRRFGLLIANKKRFLEILRTGNKRRYNELCQITGLAWHPTQNSASVEIEYIDFIEQFLTKYFEEAKKKGNRALQEYFNAFSGVCFEDRARVLEEYVPKHPLDLNTKEVMSVSDWSTDKFVEEAYMKEATALALSQDTIVFSPG